MKQTKIFYEKTPLFFFTTALILGLALSFYEIPLKFFIILCLVFIFYFSYTNKIFKTLWVVCVFVIFLFGTFYWNYLKKTKSFISSHTLELLVYIKSIEPYYQKYQVFADSAIGKIRFQVDTLKFQPGDICLLNFQIPKSSEYFNPFFLEKKIKLLASGIQEELKLIKTSTPICKKDKRFDLETLRFKLILFSEKLPPLAKGLFQALVLGQESNLPSEYLEKLKNQGLYHLLAISGFNIAILYGLFYKILRFSLRFTPLIKIGYPIQNIAYILALPAAFLILLFSGFCPSAVRAFIFLILFVVSKILFRNTSALSILFLTILILLLIQPLLIRNISFQLSALATMGLILSDRIYKKYFFKIFPDLELNKKYLSILIAIFNKVIYIFFISLIVSIFIFPIILYINGSFPLGTPFNNIIATGFWSFIFIPFSIFIAILSLFSETLAIKLSYLLGIFFNFYNKIPFLEISYTPNIPVNLFLIWIFISLVFFFIIKNKFSKYKFILINSIIFIILYFLISILYHKIFFITVFDVGKGEAILIKNPEGISSHYILWNTGPNFVKFSNFNWTRIYLLPVFKKLGINEINTIFISNLDLHYKGGLETINKYFKIEKIFAGNCELYWEDFEIIYLVDFIKKPHVIKDQDLEIYLIPKKENLIGYFEYKGLTGFFAENISKIKNFKNKIYFLPSEIVVSSYKTTNWLNKKFNFIKPKIIIISDKSKIKKEIKSFIFTFSTQNDGAVFVFPKKTQFLVCTEKEKRKNFFLSALFPIVPVYLDFGNCYRFDYHKI
ncbi:hypothetical protein DRN73_01480 [Candidatus Pacearchaeota archaeon]|nr:MAG: hypothetical protein DRN73_01480 [Candidatus Pacearchaeota archaeon]